MQKFYYITAKGQFFLVQKNRDRRRVGRITVWAHRLFDAYGSILMFVLSVYFFSPIMKIFLTPKGKSPKNELNAKYEK